MHVDPRQQPDEHRRGHDEGETGDEETRPARAMPSHGHRQLRGRGTGDQIRDAQHVDELLARDPAATRDALARDQRDLRGRTAERGQPQGQKDERDFTER